MKIDKNLMAIAREDPTSFKERIFWAKEWMKKKHEPSRYELKRCVLEGCRYIHPEDREPLIYRLISYILR